MPHSNNSYLAKHYMCTTKTQCPPWKHHRRTPNKTQFPCGKTLLPSSAPIPRGGVVGRRPDKLCTSLLHLLPSCARAWVSANGFPVHSSALSVHRFLSLPLFLFPSTVPCPFLCTVCPSFPLSASLSLPPTVPWRLAFVRPQDLVT